jgi:hypothetical protein
MADKLKAVVIGAYPRFAQKIKKRLDPILDYRLVMTTERVKPDYFNDVSVVIVLSDYVGKLNASHGRDLARARGVPFVECSSENYVRPRLLEMKLIVDEEKKQQTEHAPAAVEQNHETSIGLTHDQVLQYLPQARKSVEELLAPGAIVDETLFMPVLAEYVGLPIDIIKSLLIPELIACGLIANTVGTTWRRMTGAGVEYRYMKGGPEAPKPRSTLKAAMFRNIQGLHPGPYRSKYAIAKEMEKYKEFAKQDGTTPTTNYLQRIVWEAQENEVVSEKDGQFFIKQEEEGVKLTLIQKPEMKKEEPPAEKPKPEPATEVKVGGTTIPSSFVSLSSLKVATLAPVTPTAALAALPASQTAVERPIGSIVLDDVPLQLPMLKKMMPEKFWDEASSRALTARLLEAGQGGRSLAKGSFSVQEWDALAWETLKKLPLANIIPILMPEKYQDMRVICQDCGKTFVFTAAKQEEHFRRWGEVKPYRTCYQCSAARKAGEPTDDDFGQRILNRTGGT